MSAIVPFKEYTWPSTYDCPMDHQIETTVFMLSNLRAFILNEMGTGKTLSVLWALDFLLTNQKIKKICIFCPLSTIYSVWSKHLKQHMPHRKHAVLHHSSRAKRIELLTSSDAEIFIINHDGIKVIHHELLSANFDVVIIDEITAFANLNTDRTKAMIKLTGQKWKTGQYVTKAVYGMTGEPTPNAPTQAFAQAKIINPDNPMLPKYFTQFRALTMYQLNEFTWIPLPDAEKYVHRILQPSIRFTRDECLTLPPRTFSQRDVQLTKEQQADYKAMFDDLLIAYEHGEISAANAAVKAIKLSQISAGAVKNDDGSVKIYQNDHKLSEILEIFDELSNKKLIIYTCYTARLYDLRDKLRNKGFRVETINGDVDAISRGKIVDDFQDNDKYDILVIHPKAAAHGITLTTSNTIIWNDPHPSAEIYHQANDRITREGQKLHQLVIQLISSPVEARTYQALDRKENVSAAVLSLFKRS